jgi:hypothetical protein
MGFSPLKAMQAFCIGCDEWTLTCVESRQTDLGSMRLLPESA